MTDVTEANVEQTKPAPPAGATEVSKLHVSKNDSGKWEASLEYRDSDGKTIQGETRTFDEFSQASAWIAGTDVEVQQQAKETMPS